VDNEAVDSIRAELTGMSGAARTRPLLRLGQAFTDRYWRTGPGLAAALPDLNEAIKAFEEACGYFDRRDTFRGIAAAQLGWLLGARHLAHGGSEHDRENGILLLEEALTFSSLPPTLRTMARLVLGQLYLSRLARGMQSTDLIMAAMRSGSAPPAAAEADRAVDCFRQVLADEPTSPDLTNMAQSMLTGAEALQTMLGGLGQGLGGFDFGRMRQAMAAMERLQQQAAGGGVAPGANLPPMPSFFDAEKMAAADPLDRPVTVIEGQEPVAPSVPRPRREDPVPVELAPLRLTLRNKVTNGADLYASVAVRLRPDAPEPGIDTVDELVALATSIVHEAGKAATAEDHFILAVALYLRSRIDDGGGWVDDDAVDDVQNAAESLLTAAGTLLAEHSDAVPVLVALAKRLDERRPAGRVLDGLADRFADVAEALRVSGVEALVYPQPDGLLVVDGATGRLTFADSGGSLPRRVLVVGDEQLPDDDAMVSYVTSAAQVVDLAQRTPRSVTEAPVFVANPRGDRESATIDAMLLRRTYYPRSVGLGRTVENVDGAGTPDEVLAHLGASMLHLGCGISATGALELAGAAELDPTAIARWTGKDPVLGGLAVLPPMPERFVALADALLAAGFTGVVGWVRPVPEPVAALMLFVLHAKLVDEGRPAAAAVLAVRQWMRDPVRKGLSYLPVGYTATAAGTDLTDRAYWTALVHRGI
jgi:hypothetical protein